MNLHSQSFNTKNATLNFQARITKLTIMKKIQSFLKHHKVNIIN